jgi:hypothetical protein
VIFEPDCKLREIGESAFESCGIQSIRIPKNVEIIGRSCFSACECLSEVVFESGSKLRRINGFEDSA